MRTNGTLRYAVITEGGENEYGEVDDTASVNWSDKIPCSIKTLSDSRIGKYEDGEFRQASYQILIELAEFPYNRIQLERLGEDLGEHRVISAEPLSTVGRTQIIV